MSDTKDRERAAYNKAFSACIGGISHFIAIAVRFGNPRIRSRLRPIFDPGYKAGGENRMSPRASRRGPPIDAKSTQFDENLPDAGINGD
jgi:hypothetical protein